jgi:diguanylate cyclase (GGDEF)-like protein
MLDVAEELNADRASFLLRLAALTCGAMYVPLVAAAVPTDEPITALWLGIGGIATAVALTMVAFQLRMVFRSRATVRPHAVSFLVQNLLVYVAGASFAYGFGGDAGMFRLLLLAPLLWMAVIGNRLMYALSYCCAIGSLAALTFAASGVDGTSVGVVLAYSLGFLFTSDVVRVLARTTTHQLRRRDRFDEVTDAAAQATDVQAGLDAMVVSIARFLAVPEVAVYPVGRRTVQDEPLAAYPRAPDLDARQLADLRVASWDERLLARDNWTCKAVRGADGVALVLLVNHPPITVFRRAVHDHAVERVAVQLGVLLTRLDLVTRLEALTRTDDLTGLPNRRALTEQLDHALAVAGRSGTPLSLVMIDLDHFKEYNDSFGHLAGDELLGNLADLLRTRLRRSDFAARYGGEEFCLLLASTDAESGVVLLQELHRRCGELPGERAVTFSAGIAEWDGDETSAELLDRADQALYEAKASGRDRTIVAGWARTEPAPASGAAVWVRGERATAGMFEVDARRRSRLR